MGRGPSKKGIEQRRKILAELARRYLEFEPQPTTMQLSSATGIPRGTLEHHLRMLRKSGMMHPNDLWITRAGFESVESILRLTS